MVVGSVDQLFRGLADATRRDILRRCALGEPSVSGLAEAYPMSFAAVQKHVAVLERAGLITKERRGREKRVRTEAAAVAGAGGRSTSRGAVARAGGRDVRRPHPNTKENPR